LVLPLNPKVKDLREGIEGQTVKGKLKKKGLQASHQGKKGGASLKEGEHKKEGKGLSNLKRKN